jgi:hypothetical protein
LVLDFAKYKSPPVWVGADSLFSAMVMVDGTARAITQMDRSDWMTMFPMEPRTNNSIHSPKVLM